MSYDTLEEFWKHTQSMRNLTKNEIVNMYWTNINDIAREKKLPFIIRGNLQWKSEYPNGVNITENILLKSNFYEAEGKSIFHEPVRRYLQFDMNLFEIWVIIDVDIDPNDVENSKAKIMTALNTIVVITDALSFLLGGSLQWWPGRLFRSEAKGQTVQPEQSDWRIIPLRSDEERTSTLLEDKHLFLELIPFIGRLENLRPDIGKHIKTAINWHSTANRISNGLNRFLNYWSSIELLGTWYYDKLNAGAYATAETKIVELLNNFDDKDRFIDILYNENNDIEMNFYDMRNAIAHGRISEYDFDEIQSYNDRLFELRSISMRIIIETIRNSDKLSDNLTRASKF